MWYLVNLLFVTCHPLRTRSMNLPIQIWSGRRERNSLPSSNQFDSTRSSFGVDGWVALCVRRNRTCVLPKPTISLT